MCRWRSNTGAAGGSSPGQLATIVLGLLALLALIPWRGLEASPLCDSLSNGRFDIVYVCPAAWRSQVARLAIHRANPVHGAYSSIIAPTETLTTCYGAGRAGIRAMVHQALAHWSSPPAHVVLVGAFGDQDTTTFVIPSWFIVDPPISFWTDPPNNFLGLVPTDDPYVFSPGATDSIPAVSIGRIPVWNLSDLSTYISKLISYETAGLPSWQTTALRVVEDRDLEGNSGALARAHADSLGPYFGPKAQANFYTSSLYGTQVNTSIDNNGIIQAWNAGVGYALFYGTAGFWQQFAFFFQNDAACISPRIDNCTTSPCTLGDSLSQNNKTPVVLAMTCANGLSGMLPGQPSTCSTLGQYLLATPNKGAVSVTGPSRAMHEIPGYAVAREWYKAAFGLDTTAAFAEPGRVLRQVKQAVMSTMPTYHSEILGTFALGDPAVRFYVGGSPVIEVGQAPPPKEFRARALGSPARELAFALDMPRAGIYELRLFDLQGRLVDSRHYVAGRPTQDLHVTFDSAEAPTGIYFLLAQGAGLIASAKLVLIR